MVGMYPGELEGMVRAWLRSRARHSGRVRALAQREHAAQRGRTGKRAGDQQGLLAAFGRPDKDDSYEPATGAQKQREHSAKAKPFKAPTASCVNNSYE